MPGWLMQALPDSGGQSLYLRLRPGVLECLKEKDDLPYHEIKLSLPLPTPIRVTEDDREPRLEGFWPGRRVGVASNLKALTLQTLKGESFRFTVKTDGGGPGPKTAAGEAIVLAFLPSDESAARRIARILEDHGI
ncbi:MAG: hypothetical protein L0Y38_04750, partial [Methylococcaceae bacterium]|nr:hypothetical protein [Methylococcaceae bacterium]